MAKSVIIPLALKNIFYAVLGTGWCSGIVFFCLNQWVTVQGDFGPEKHPWQSGFLQIHGAGAFLMMVLFGYLLASHVQAAWPLKNRNPLGLALLAMIVFLIVSAYGLYYLGDEDLRTYLAYAHAGVGACLPLVLAAHLVQVRRLRKHRKTVRKTKTRTAVT